MKWNQGFGLAMILVSGYEWNGNGNGIWHKVKTRDVHDQGNLVLLLVLCLLVWVDLGWLCSSPDVGGCKTWFRDRLRDARCGGWVSGVLNSGRRGGGSWVGAKEFLLLDGAWVQ